MKKRGKTAKIRVTVLALLGSISFVSVGAAAVVNATARSSWPGSYVALGDSVAAGAGLPLVQNPSPEDVACGRSGTGYPQLLGTKLNVPVTDLACSGARVHDGLIDPQTIPGANIVVPAQLDQAFARGVPDVMTLTVGANDVHWVDFIGKCYVGTCGSLSDTATAAAYLTYFQGELAYSLHAIKDRSGGHAPPRVFITGYYYPVSSTACLGGQVTTAELRWINAQTDNLNKAIRQTISATTRVSSWFKGSYNFATYVPINFNGHGLCSSEPWVQGLAEAAPLHPNASGTAEFAATLSARIK